nr:hypothetical protein [uncultured Carboxylicivirga sp.]
MLETRQPPKKLCESTFHLWLGLITGFLYAFALYGFLFMSRETLRLFAINSEYDLPVLNEEEQLFYNLFAGLLAGVLAQSVVLRFWIDKPMQVFTNHDHRRRVILNDAGVLPWYFMHWMAKIVLVIANFFYVCTTDYYILSFYPAFWFLFILILVVLFLQPWIAVRRIYKNKAFKMIGLAFAIIAINGFFLSKINIIDIESINKFFLSKNIRNEYHLQLPEVYDPEEYYLRDGDEVLYMVLSSRGEPTIFFNQKEYSFDQLTQEIEKINPNISWTRDVIYRLNIDQRCNYKDVLRLKRVFQLVGIHRVFYSVLPVQREFDDRYYTRWGMSDYIPSSKVPQPPFLDNSKLKHTDIKLTPTKVLINNIDKDNLWQQELKNKLKEYSQLLIHFYCEDDVPFGVYIQFKDELKGIIREVRMNYLQQYYGKKDDYSDYTFTVQKEAREKFAIHLKEMDLIN